MPLPSHGLRRRRPRARAPPRGLLERSRARLGSHTRMLGGRRGGQGRSPDSHGPPPPPTRRPVPGLRPSASAPSGAEGAAIAATRNQPQQRLRKPYGARIEAREHIEYGPGDPEFAAVDVESTVTPAERSPDPVPRWQRGRAGRLVPETTAVLSRPPRRHSPASRGPESVTGASVVAAGCMG